MSVAASVDPSAQADRFLTALGPVPGVTNPLLVSMGERACSALQQGQKAEEVRTIMFEKGLSTAQASKVMLAAVVTYCPDYAHVVNP